MEMWKDSFKKGALQAIFREMLSYLGIPGLVVTLLMSSLASLAAFWSEIQPIIAVLIGLLFFVLVLVVFAIIKYLRDRPKTEAGAANENDVTPISPKRISLIDFYKEAENQGWTVTFDETLHLLDLALGIRQAALDGDVKVYGRPENMFNSITRSEPLRELTKDSWDTFQINALSCVKFGKMSKIIGFAEDNFLTEVYVMGDKVKYRDIYLDRSQALHWLKSEALQFKGRTRAIEDTHA